jgi:hypothetical protein
VRRFIQRTSTLPSSRWISFCCPRKQATWTGRVQNQINDNGFFSLRRGWTDMVLYAGLTGLLSTNLHNFFFGVSIDGQRICQHHPGTEIFARGTRCAPVKTVCVWWRLSTEQRLVWEDLKRLPSDYTACVEFLWHWAAALLDRRCICCVGPKWR